MTSTPDANNTVLTTVASATSPSPRGPRRMSGVLAAGAAAALLATGCGPADTAGPAGTDEATPPSAPGQTTAPEASPTSPAAAAEPLAVTDPWARAMEEGAMMTGVFGEVTNTTDDEVQIVEAESPRAGDMELHETVEDGTGATVMQEREGGFTIPAGEALELVPGGDHLMLMDVEEPIEPGEEVEITLELSDGQVQTMTAVARDFAGGNETYEGTDEADSGGH